MANLAEHEPWLLDHIPAFGRTFLDVGASTGLFSQYLAPKFKRVIAVEPNPIARAELERNLTGATIIPEAAWDSKGVKTLHLFESLLHGSFFNETPDWQTKKRLPDVEVSTFTIDSLNLGDLDFVKVDTEGAEVEILKGATETLKRCHPKLLIEIHNKDNGDSVIEFLRKNGYDPSKMFHKIEIIRHPNYSPDSPEQWRRDGYWGHFWIDAL
jgi:FkbM family methyltransferase